MKERMQLNLSGGRICGGLCWDRLTERRIRNKRALDRYGYKVYSQNDEDGIIQEIFRRIGTSNRVFVEFGVQDGLESNCHYLLHRDWTGLWIEGDEDCVRRIHSIFSPVIRCGQLKVLCSFVTRENINDLIRDAGISGEIDLLSLDIDGNEYYVWEEINVIRPRVVVVEYNGKFPPDYAWKMAYNAEHVWDGYSDWQGASLKAYEELGDRLGYQLVGTDLRGVNAFFVRKDLTRNRFYKPATAEALYNPLRLDLEFVSFHPSGYCLKNQTEGLGLLDYFPYLLKSGFYPVEQSKDGTSHSWINALSSRMNIRVDKGTKRLEIPYTLPGEIVKMGYFVEVRCGDTVIRHDIEKSLGSIEVPVEASGPYVSCEFSVPFLWKPSEVLQLVGDDRTLGIDLVVSAIKTFAVQNRAE